MGGGSTEIVVLKNGELIERKNIDIGVGVLLSRFVGINEEFSKVKKWDVIDFVGNFLPDLDTKVSKAFYTGGELNYMKLAGYPLVRNELFEDEKHPSMIFIDEFSLKNEEVFPILGFLI